MIRHILIVDPHKRYSIGQIKQHKWMIQGEPYDDLSETESGFVEHHEGDNGICVYNEKVLQEIESQGEDKESVLEVCFIQ